MPTNNSTYTLLYIPILSSETESAPDVLRNANFHTLQACYQKATQIAESTPPDLIIIDTDNYTQHKNQIIREFKNNKNTFRIPVLILSPLPDENNFPSCLNYDDIDFIIKPYHPQELIIRIQHQLLLQHALRRQNTKLKQTLEARDKLYSIIAHDLRTPISTIKMVNSSIENQIHKIKDPAIVKLFRIINETTEEAFNLLENLLRWTRNQSGKTKVYATTFNINIIIRQVISLFHTSASNKDITIHNHATEHITVYADEDMIKTVLRNLISNAIKFTYPGGQIDISATSLPECILISVKDNGKGISKKDQKKLLKPNEYITTYGTRNEKGSGLGLTLSQDFIKLNKGKLWFSSQEGIGTTFFFTLSNPPTKS